MTRAGELVLFLGHRRVERIDQPNLWPELERFDIAISTAPEACKSPPGSCEFVYHDLRVTRRGESAVRSANGALQVGALTVVGSLFEGVNTFRFDSLHLGVNALGFVSPSRAGP